MSAPLRFSKATTADSPERVSKGPFGAPKQNGPPFSGPFVFDVEPISWPVQARVPEPAPVPGQELVQAPERVPELGPA